MTKEEQKRTEILKSLDDYRLMVGDMDTLALLIYLSAVLSEQNNIFKDNNDDTIH